MSGGHVNYGTKHFQKQNPSNGAGDGAVLAQQHLSTEQRLSGNISRHEEDFIVWAMPLLSVYMANYVGTGLRAFIKRVQERMRMVGIPSSAFRSYRQWVDANPHEWQQLHQFTLIHVSSFCRDTAVFDKLRDTVLPAIKAAADAFVPVGQGDARVWSAGCSRGQECYSLRFLWDLDPWLSSTSLQIIGTDLSPDAVREAQKAQWSGVTVDSLPPDWVDVQYGHSQSKSYTTARYSTPMERKVGVADGTVLPLGSVAQPKPSEQRPLAYHRFTNELSVKPAWRDSVDFRCEDIRRTTPEGEFDLIMCRNSVLMYFSPQLQEEVLPVLVATKLKPGGYFVIGHRDRMPAYMTEASGSKLALLDIVDESLGIFRKPL
jgi:chemotaxis protein methyltransferase CheR